MKLNYLFDIKDKNFKKKLFPENRDLSTMWKDTIEKTIFSMLRWVYVSSWFRIYVCECIGVCVYIGVCIGVYVCVCL